MANDKKTSEYPERLLGRMLAEAAKARAGGVPEDSRPSDEAILKLYEQLSDPSTKAADRAEAMSVLMRDSETYARWLTFSRFMEKHAGEGSLHRNPSTAKPARPLNSTANESMGQKLQRLLSGFWYNPALSAAFGLALGVLVTSLYTGTPRTGEHDGHGPVLSQQGVPLPRKASQDTAGTASEPSTAAATQLGQSMRCIDTHAALPGRLCYTATSPDQQWFQISGSDQVRAITAPLDTDRIIDVSTRQNLLLVEHQRSGEFQISLLQINDEPQGLNITLLHGDAAANGYFDDVVLDDDGLSYKLHRGDEVIQRHFVVP
ncbi:hypothetical protein [Allohahella marinimesophila]|uniref:Uncharacterized protein n=1 Tax=Allohahella marinimesophila TaxID=1054972 RepID=A0ABP7NI47_9GAMM